MGVWSSKEKNKYLKDEKMRKKKKMREINVEWRMGEGRRSSPTRDLQRAGPSGPTLSSYAR